MGPPRRNIIEHTIRLVSSFEGSGGGGLGIAHLLQILFRQAVINVLQPDRLYPLLLSNSNVVGDVMRDQPPIFLSGGTFCSENTVRLHVLLSAYEAALFPSSTGSMCNEESAIQYPTTLLRYMNALL